MGGAGRRALQRLWMPCAACSSAFSGRQVIGGARPTAVHHGFFETSVLKQCCSLYVSSIHQPNCSTKVDDRRICTHRYEECGTMVGLARNSEWQAVPLPGSSGEEAAGPLKISQPDSSGAREVFAGDGVAIQQEESEVDNPEVAMGLTTEGSAMALQLSSQGEEGIEGESVQEGSSSKSMKYIRGESVNIDAEMLPRVMLVGRPNVGKSALFNRLTRRREALVYNTPDSHVTRDVREGIAKLGDLRFQVMDTAGLETSAESESVLARTAGLTAAVLRECQIALFLIDGRAGLQPLDADVGKWLRKLAPHVRVMVLLNKAEGMLADTDGSLTAAIGEAYSLGFGEPVAVSAESGQGLADLFDRLHPWVEDAQDRIFTKKAAETCLREEEDMEVELKKVPLQLAIAGRPNVGKSTLLNALLREERVLTGPEPGLTRDCVRVQFEYEGQTVYLVDTAGWMQRVKVKEGPAALSAMHSRRTIQRAHIVALVLDAEEIAQTKSSMRHAEAALAQWVVQEGRGLVVVVNKMDLLAGSEQARLRALVMHAVPEEIRKVLPQVTGVPVVFVSALEGKGRAAIMRNVLETYDKWCSRLTTAQLNRWLRKVMSRHPRRGEQSHGAKVRYMTQVKARPPTFVVFVSGSGKLQDTDLRFLASALREDFDLGGIPLRVLQRGSKD